MQRYRFLQRIVVSSLAISFVLSSGPALAANLQVNAGVKSNGLSQALSFETVYLIPSLGLNTQDDYLKVFSRMGLSAPKPEDYVVVDQLFDGLVERTTTHQSTFDRDFEAFYISTAFSYRDKKGDGRSVLKTTTDALGRATFSGVPAGEWRLVLEHKGRYEYYSWGKIIQLTSGNYVANLNELNASVDFWYPKTFELPKNSMVVTAMGNRYIGKANEILAEDRNKQLLVAAPLFAGTLGTVLLAPASLICFALFPFVAPDKRFEALRLGGLFGLGALGSAGLFALGYYPMKDAPVKDRQSAANFGSLDDVQKIFYAKGDERFDAAIIRRMTEN